VRTAAWSGLISAVDHLARDELNMRPTALLTDASRAAGGFPGSVGTEQQPDVPPGAGTGDCRRRAVTAPEVPTGLHKRRVCQGQLQSGLHVLDDDLSAEITRIRKLRKALPHVDTDTTTMMQEAAAHLTKGGSPDDHGMQFALAYEWRVASAAAHGRSCPTSARRTDKTRPRTGNCTASPPPSRSWHSPSVQPP
jgi:hypothetical protein